MTIASTPRKAGPMNGNGVQSAWPFAFKVFAKADVKVTIANSAGVETVLVLDSHYSVTLNGNQETSPGGTVTYPISGTKLPTGSVLAITGDLDYDQPLDLPSGGNFSPLSIENQLDRSTMQIQQLREEMDRTAKLPPTSSESVEELVDDLQRLADSADNIDTVAGSVASVNTVAANVDDVNTVAANIGAVVATGANIAAVVTVAADLNEPVSEINTVAGSIANVNAVGADIANVNAVAGITADVSTVADIAADVSTVADNVADVTNFADVYQGAKASDPTLRNDGSALQSGDLYFNTTENALRTYSGTLWVAGTAGIVSAQAFSGDGVETEFVLNTAPASENNTQVYISGVYQQKDRYSVSGDTLTFGTAPPAGDDNIEVVTISTLALGETDAALVTYLPAGTGAVATDVQAKLREHVSVSEYATVQDAVTHALTNGLPLYWPDADFTASGNIENLWDVQHCGPGRLIVGADTWHPEPVGSQVTVIYVAQGGLASNDGVTASTPTTMQSAINKISTIGAKGQNGVWRIQMLAAGGTIQGGGVKLIGDTESLPVFKNPLQIWGEAAGFTSVPTVIWNGESGTEPFAFRIEHSQSLVNIHFKHIKFTNWNRDSGNANASYPLGVQGGAVLIWNDGTLLLENCHADNCYAGFWYNRVRVRQTFGVVSNCVTYGISPQYHSKANIGAIGGLGSGGVDFINCGNGVSVGRNTICYVQGSRFTTCVTCIDVNRESRIRTQDNSFVSWSYAVVECSLNSAWTPDNGSGNPDAYASGVLSTTAPAYRATNGGVHLLVDRLSQRSLHSVSSGLVTITNKSGIQSILSDVAFSTADNAPTWVPFRLPGWFLYSPTALLEVDLSLTLSANAAGVLSLNGEGSAAAATLGSVTIPTSASVRTVRCTITAKQYTTSAMRVYFAIPELSLFTQATSPSLNVTALRTNNEADMLFRLYWTPADANQTQFYAMRTYVEA